MYLSSVALAIFAAVAAAAPVANPEPDPQISFSGPLGSVSLGPPAPGPGGFFNPVGEIVGSVAQGIANAFNPIPPPLPVGYRPPPPGPGYRGWNTETQEVQEDAQYVAQE